MYMDEVSYWFGGISMYTYILSVIWLQPWIFHYNTHIV